MSSTLPAEAGASSASTRRAWFGFMAPHVAWAVHIMIVYPLVPLVCRTGQHWILWAFSAAMLAIAVWATVVAWLLERRLRPVREETVGGTRNHFLARAGIVVGIFFSIVIVMESLPLLYEDPCR